MIATSQADRDTRNPTLRTRDGIRELGQSSGHTLAGFPPGNLPATLRASGLSR